MNITESTNYIKPLISDICNLCNICNLKFENGLDLIVHNKIHTSERHHNRKCIKCKVIKPVTEFYVSNYVCLECCKEKIECPKCNIWITKINFKQHEDYKHNEISKFKEKVPCSKCFKLYSRKYLYTHEKKCKIGEL